LSIKQQLFKYGGKIPFFSFFIGFSQCFFPEAPKVAQKNIVRPRTLLDQSEIDEI